MASPRTCPQCGRQMTTAQLWRQLIRVFSAEHLAAIALETGRPKDHARLVQFVDAGVLDTDRFVAILRRHGLWDKWRAFESRFFGDARCPPI